jgi:hypothetical protein
MRVLNDLLIDTTAVALSQTTNALCLDHMFAFDATATVTAANPANKTFTAAASDVITTATAHGYVTGMKLQASTDGVLPAGLAAVTDYYFIYVSTTTGKLAASQADALAGTAVDITDAGTGTHTIAVTTTIAGSVKLQKCNDPDTVAEASRTWFDVGSSSQNFTATGNLNWTAADVAYRLLRAVVTVTSGTVTAAIRLNAKGG